MIVIWGVAFEAPFHKSLYDWLDMVVGTACAERRSTWACLSLINPDQAFKI